MKLPMLRMSRALVNSAHLHTIAMLWADTLSHRLPGEASLGTRIRTQGVKWTLVAENIGHAYGDAARMAVSLNHAMFAEKASHNGQRRNILSKATIIGIDVIIDTRNLQIWLTEDFAKV